jgi:GT2 family glycosyltransferase
MQAQPLTSIVVVNYNGGSDLYDCLQSVVQCTQYPYELIVVDNASTDGSMGGVRNKFPDALVIFSEENEGYSAAVNRGLEEASGEYVAVLNMDVIVEEGWLESMVRFLEENPHAGAVNPLLLIYQDSEKINALGQIIQWSGLGFNRKLRWPRDMADPIPTRISGLQGAVFVIRADLFRRIGGMNEACFMYHEDVDLSWVIYLAGFDLFTVPDAIAYHRYALKLTPAKLQLLERNRWAMLVANLKTLTLLALTPYFIATEFLIFAYCLFHGWSFLKVKMSSIHEVWRRRDLIRERRRFIGTIRVRADASVLRIMHPILVWDQVVGLFLNPGNPKVGWMSRFVNVSGERERA